uniref:Uncharacterized protein n=1 Tax=Solanum tuberosum TaxID=4113 RepID=M1E0T0_SOLTU
MLSAYFANGLVGGFCTGTCASWRHLSNVRGEAFRKSKEAYDASVKQYAGGMNRPVLRRQEQYNPLGEIVEQSERKEGLNVVLGVNDHYSVKIKNVVELKMQKKSYI